MKEVVIKPEQQSEAIRLARVATGPALGETDFWKDVVKHLNAMATESEVVQARPERS